MRHENLVDHSLWCPAVSRVRRLALGPGTRWCLPRESIIPRRLPVRAGDTGQVGPRLMPGGTRTGQRTAGRGGRSRTGIAEQSPAAVGPELYVAGCDGKKDLRWYRGTAGFTCIGNRSVAAEPPARPPQ